jgi:hypothetical protein
VQVLMRAAGKPLRHCSARAGGLADLGQCRPHRDRLGIDAKLEQGRAARDQRSNAGANSSVRSTTSLRAPNACAKAVKGAIAGFPAGVGTRRRSAVRFDRAAGGSRLASRQLV